MDSSTLLFVAGVLLLTLILLAILYLLYKYLISETPYQRTHLIAHIDSKNTDKKLVKKVKTSGVRQRNVAKNNEDGVKKSDEPKAEKVEIDKKKSESKKKVEKVSKKVEEVASVEKLVKVTSSSSQQSLKKRGDSEEKKKVSFSEDSIKTVPKENDTKPSVSEEDVFETLIKSKKTVVQNAEPVDSHKKIKTVVEKPKQPEPELLQGNIQHVTKKKKKQNDVEVAVSLVHQQQNEIQHQQKDIQQKSLQQQQKSLQQQQKSLQQQQQQKSLQQLKQQTEVEDLKRLLSSKETQLQKETHQLKSLNDMYGQLRQLYEKEKSKTSSFDKDLMLTNKKHAEEKQALLHRMHQADQQHKQSIQLMQQELATSKGSSKEYSIVMSNLADDNAKLKAKLSQTEKLTEELASKSKTIEMLNASLRNTQIALDLSENNYKSLEGKLQHSDNFKATVDSKQKESMETIKKLEETCFELRRNQDGTQQQFQQRMQQLQQQHQHVVSDLENKLHLLEQKNHQLHTTITSLENHHKETNKTVSHTSSSPIKTTSLTNGYSSEVDGLTDERLKEVEKERDELSVKLQAKEKKNEDLRQRNWKAMEVLGEREKRLETLQLEKAELQKRLEKQLKEQQNSTVAHNDLVRVGSQQHHDGQCIDPEIDNVKELKLVAKANKYCMESQEEEIKRLHQLLQQQKDKNDELRKKNWAVMSSMNELEVKVEDLTTQLKASSPSQVTVLNQVQETSQWDIGGVVKALEEKEAELNILQSLLDQHEDAYQTLKEENEKLKADHVSQNQGDVSKMAKEVELYKKVILDTDTTLKALEANVDLREKSWKKENEQLKHTISQLEAKVSSLS